MTDWTKFEPIDSSVPKKGAVDWSQFEPIKPNDSGQFASGLKRAFAEVPGMVAGVGAFAADAVGADETRDKLLNYASAKQEEVGQAHAKDASSITDAWDGKTGWIDFLANSSGYVAGQALQSLATGGLGALGAKMLAKQGIKELAEATAAKAIAAGAGEAAAKAEVLAAVKAAAAKATNTGAVVGAGAHNFGMELGSIYPDAVEQAKKEGRDNLDAGDMMRVFAAASLAAGVDTAGEAIMANRVFRGSEAGGKTIAGRALREVPSGMLREGATEAVQTGLEHYGAGQPIADEKGLRDIIDSAGVGMVGGGLGGAGASLRARNQAPAAAPPAAEPPPAALSYNPDPFISFPDGTVGKRADVERYVAGLPAAEQPAMRAKLMGLEPQQADDPIHSILSAQSVDEAAKAAAIAISRPAANQPAAQLPELPGRTQEQTLAGITLDAETARQLAQKQAELDAIQATAPAARDDFAAQAAARQRAATVEAPTAMQLALQRAMPAPEPIAAPVAAPLPAPAPIPAPTSFDTLERLNKRQPLTEAETADVLAKGYASTRPDGRVALVQAGLKERNRLAREAAATQPKAANEQRDVPVPAPVAERAADAGADRLADRGAVVGRVADAGGAGPVRAGLPEVAAGSNAVASVGPGVQQDQPLKGPNAAAVQTEAVEAPAPAGVDAAAQAGFPDAGRPGDVQAAGLIEDKAAPSTSTTADVVAPQFKTKKNPSGTITVLGDPAAIKAALPQFKGVKTKGGVLFGVRDAQAVAKALRPAQAKPRGASRALNPEADTMLQALAKAGGVNREELAREFGMKPEELKATVPSGNLKAFPFRKAGRSIDGAIEFLQQNGYFDGVADDDVRAKFEEAIFGELGGDPRLSTRGQMARAQKMNADIEAQYQSDVADEGIYETEAERSAIIATDAAFSPEVVASITEDDVLDISSGAKGNTESLMRALGFTEQEIADELDQEQGSAAQAGPAEDRQDEAGAAPADRAGPGRQEGNSAAADEGLTLTAQTSDELRAKAQRDAAAKAADTAEQKRLADKAKADAQRDEFTLTGSDSPADIAAAAGQGGLFDAPTAAIQAAEPGKKLSVPDEPRAVVFDEALLKQAIKDSKNASGFIAHAVETDVQGVIPGKARELDRLLSNGKITEQEMRQAWAGTLAMLRERHGDSMVMYRADAPATLRNGMTRTVYMADEAVASKYASNGRQAVAYTVPMDDVLAVYARPSGYFEAIVRLPEGGLAVEKLSVADATTPATQAADILNAANVTGKERIDVLKDVKAGAITTDELKAAYPAKEVEPTLDSYKTNLYKGAEALGMQPGPSGAWFIKSTDAQGLEKSVSVRFVRDGEKLGGQVAVSSTKIDPSTGRPVSAAPSDPKTIYGSADEVLAVARDAINGKGPWANRSSPASEETTPATGVQNFGEALPPSRRQQRTSLDAALTDDDLHKKPLSEIWPAAENEAIEDKFAAAVATAARAEVPAKPRVGYKLDRWVQKVKTVRELAQKIVGGNWTREQLLDKAPKSYAMDGFWSKVALMEAIDRSDWKRIGDVHEGMALRNKDGGVTHSISVEIDGKTHYLQDGGSIADNLPAITELLGDAPQDKKMAFEVRGRGNLYFINKKGDSEYRHLKEFATAEEASKFRRENYDDLVKAWDAVKARDNVTERDLRSDANKDRVGQDWRGGKDITAEEFDAKFGFKGGEFGKWVSQGSGAQERQWMLNRAYDSLMDLATLIGIPPRAISLNGSLGIAFGSRGNGWASAHFEPDNLVINLTKTRGAGSLGHEWFHAVDNYFSRQRGGEVKFSGSQTDYRRDNYITHKPEPLMVRKEGRSSPLTKTRLEEMRKANPNSGYLAADQWQPDPKHPEGVRPVVEERFADLVKALNDAPMTKRASLIDKGKSEGYWSQTLERAARSFEVYLIAKMAEHGQRNDYLANVTPIEEFGRDKGRYPYPTPTELKPIAEAFDALFDTIQTRETDKGTALFSRSEPGKAADTQAEQNALQALSENDELFQLPRSDKDTVEGIAADNNRKISVSKITSIPGETRYNFTLPSGKTARLMVRDQNPYGSSLYGYNLADGEMSDAVTERPGENPEDVPPTGDVWIDVSLLESGDEGRTIYNIAATYAHNTGRIFIGDPAGLSDEAMRRRPEMMLSSALKFGTTAHLAPHPRQVTGDKRLGIAPLRWVYGDDLGNIRRLIDLNLKALENAGLDAITYDPASGQFLDSQNKPIDRAGIAELAASGYGRGALAGASTLARGSVLNALSREENRADDSGRRNGDGLLERLVRQSAVHQSATEGILYSRRDLDAGRDRILAARESASRPNDAQGTGQELTARVAEVQGHADKITSAWKGAPEVIVAANMQDDSIPQAARDSEAKQRSQGAGGEPEGFFFDGKVYLIASALKSEKDVSRVLFHEVLGHAGLRGTFGSSLDSVLKTVAVGRPADMKRIAAKYGLDLTNQADRMEAAEEVLAYMAQEKPDSSLVQRAIAAIRTWLRENIGALANMRLSDAEIIRNYIMPARAFIERGGEAKADGEARFSIKEAITETEAFKRWFGDSAVVDAQGKPLVMYHGTPYRQITEFETKAFGALLGKGAYFTADPSDAEQYAGKLGNFGASPNIMPAYVSLKNPLEVRSVLDKIPKQAELIELGYDGVLLLNGDESVKWAIAFEPKQIKSATGNNGAFDPANPDIRFSRTMGATESALGKLSAAQQAAATRILGDGATKTLKQRYDAMRADLGLRAKQALVDQFAAIKEYDPKAYMAARMSKGADGTLEALMMYGKPFMRDGAPDVKVDEGGFGQVLANLKGEHQRFFLWVAAQRAERLKAIGLENLFSSQDIATLKTLNQGKFADGSSREAAFLKAQQQLNEFNDAVLKVAEESGLIDAEARKLFKDAPYVPFYRAMEEGEMTGPRFSSGLVNQKAFKTLKGGKDQLNGDLLSNVLLNWSHLFQASANNRAAAATMKAAVAMDAAYPVAAGTKGAVRVMEQGQAQSYAIEDPYLLQAVSSLNYMAPQWIKPLAVAKKWLTMSVTANPAFKVRNLIRDSISAIAQADLSPNALDNLAKGWKATRKDSQTYASMMAGGGLMRFGTVLEGNRADRAHDLVHKLGGEVLDESGAKALWRKTTETWDAYQELGDRTEQVNRAALYERLIEKGYSHEEASFMSRDLLDFSMSGAAPVVRFLTQTVPFLNARLQGLYKLGRAANENPQRFWAVAGSVALASVALYAAYSDDEDWKKREDWDRDSSWWFKIGDKAFRIPKPFEVGSIGTVAERTFELMFDKEMTGQRYRQRLSAMLFQTFAMDPTPQLIKPLLDVYSNKDSFTDRPIESLALQRLRPQDRSDQNTSPLANLLGQIGLPNPAELAKGRWSDLSPKQVDFLLRGYFGWFAAVAATASGEIQGATSNVERPDRKLKDWFLAGNFVESLPSGSSRYVTAMYEQAREIEEAYGSYRAALKSGDIEAAKDIMASDGDKIAKYHRIEALKRRESEVNAAIKRVQQSKTLDGNTKRVMIDGYERMRGTIAQAMAPR